MNFGMMHDLGGLFAGIGPALLPATITAGAGNDGVEVDGPSIDRLLSGRKLYKSGALLVFGRATLAEAATLTLSGNLQDDTVTGFSDAPADYGDAIAATVVATGPSGGGTVDWVYKLKVDLTGARQFIRAQLTLNLSAGSVDTVAAAALFVLGFAEESPAD